MILHTHFPTELNQSNLEAAQVSNASGSGFGILERNFADSAENMPAIQENHLDELKLNAKALDSAPININEQLSDCNVTNSNNNINAGDGDNVDCEIRSWSNGVGTGNACIATMETAAQTLQVLIA